MPALWPHIGGYVVAVWLTGMIANLLSSESSTTSCCATSGEEPSGGEGQAPSPVMQPTAKIDLVAGENAAGLPQPGIPARMQDGW